MSDYLSSVKLASGLLGSLYGDRTVDVDNDKDKDDDNEIICNLSIEGQVAVADVVVSNSNKRGKTASGTVKTRLDFTGVSDSQLLLWAAKSKMVALKRNLSDCTLMFIRALVRQGPTCCSASEDGNIFKATDDSLGKKLEEFASEYFCSVYFEGQVAVIDFDVWCTVANSKQNFKFQFRLDFSGVPDSQVLLWAAQSKMEDLHSALINCDKQLLKDLANIGVKRHASSAGSPFDESSKKQNRAMAVAQGMSAEARAELIRQLQEMDK